MNLPRLEIRTIEDDTIRVNVGDLLRATGHIYVNDPRVHIERAAGTPLVWCDEGYVIRFHPDFEWKFGVDGTGQTVAVAIARTA